MLNGKVLAKRLVAAGVAVAVAALMAPPAWVACVPGGIVAGPQTAQADPVWSGDFAYEVEGSYAKIVEYKVEGAKAVVIPETLGGKPVKEIADRAFDEYYDKWHDSSDGVHRITSVEIPASVETIGERAFQYCTNLSKVTIKGNGLYYIGAYAFTECGKLTSFTFPSGLSQISSGAFAGCALTSVSIPKDCAVLNSDRNPFARCPVTKFTVASGNNDAAVIDSGKMLVDNSKNVLYSYAIGSSSKSVKIPTSIGNIGEGAFEGAKITSVSIHKGVRVISVEAFHHCDKLKKVTIPQNSKLDKIGDRAFYNCKNLKKVYIPKTVDFIGEDALGGWTKYEGSEEPEGQMTAGFYLTGETSSYEGLKYAKNHKITLLTTSKVSKLTPKKKALKVKVKKAKGVSSSKKAYKYQIYYKQKGKKSWKKIKIKSTTKTIKKLKKGKKYQVKVRSMKKVSGKYIYGEWSAVKTSKKIK